MTRNRFLALALYVLILTGLAVWGLCGISKHLIITLDKYGDAGAQVRQTLQTVDQPCSKGKPCGTLAKIDQSLNEVDTAVVHLDLVARHEQQQLVTYDRYTAELMTKVTGLADSLQRTSDALTGTATAATQTLNEGKATIARAQPLLDNLAATADASTATIKTFNGRLSDPRVDALLTDFRSMADSGTVMAAQGAIITTDLRKEADTLTAPEPLWKKLVPGAELGAKIWACAVEHVCVD